MQKFEEKNWKNFELLQEFKNVLNINNSLINSQKKLFQIVNEKFLKIEYVICKILQNHSCLLNSNQNYLKNLFKVDEFLLPSSFYYKLNRFDPIFSEIKLKDIEKRIERRLNIMKINSKKHKNEISKNFFSENTKQNENFDKKTKISRQSNFFSVQPQNKNKKEKNINEKNCCNCKDFKILTSSHSFRKKDKEHKSSIPDSSLDKNFFLNKSLMKIYNKTLQNSSITVNDYANSDKNKENSKNNAFNDSNSLENVNCENDDKENIISLPYDMKKIKISKEGSSHQIYSPLKEKKIIKNLMEKAYKDIKNNSYHHGKQLFIYK